MHRYYEQVSALIAGVADEVILPRFRMLAKGEAYEKSPGEVVTIADCEAERLLSAGLARLDRAARVIGEEACSAAPELLEGLDSGLVWLIDPLDGTSNFASGTSVFGVMIALVADGVTQAGWIYHPLARRMYHAAAGRGAFLDGQPMRVRPSTAALPIAALASQFMPPPLRDYAHQAMQQRFTVVPIPRCAAEHYPRLVRGDNDVALFQRTLPWDHAAGALYVCEAGGHVARWDGSPYHLADGRSGLLVANSRARWDEAAEQLFPVGNPLAALARQPLSTVGT